MWNRSILPNQPIRIQCVGNHFHDISINANGQFALLNHTQQDRERLVAWRELGAPVQGCHRFLERWRHAMATGHRWSFLPSKVLPYWRTCRELQRQRQRQARQSEKQEAEKHLRLPIYERPEMLTKLFNRLISSRLNLPEGDWVRVTSPGGLWYRLILQRQSRVAGTVNNNELFERDWFRTIHQPGFSVCKRGIIVRMFYRAARQGRAIIIRPVDRGDGTMGLSFENTIIRLEDWEAPLIAAPVGVPA